MAARFLAGCLLLIAVFFNVEFAAAQQSPIPPQYCYDGRCYRTLAQAEADLRASTGIYGALWHLDGVTQTGSGPLGVVLDYRYWIDDEPPAAKGPIGYAVGGGVAYPSEEAGIAAYLAGAQASNPQCEHERVGMLGVHGEPYVHVRASGRKGTVLNFSMVGNDPQPNRYVQIQTWCAAWSPPSPPRIDKVWVPKQYEVECAEGFLVKEGSNPAYIQGASNIGWPNICRPNTIPRVITGRNIKQTNSCPINGNPCHPATGDKSRAEVDFTFAGREFVRYYHSLNQLQAARELGTGWTHTYADFILTGSSNQTRVDEKGYLQTYSGGRGTQASGETLRAGPASTMVLTGADGAQRIYGNNGQLIQIASGESATRVVLSYDGSRLTSITDGKGRSLVFAYENNRLSSITLPDGSQATYAYDATGNLTQVIRPDGTTRTYVYGEAGYAPAALPNLLTGILENGARYATFSFDQNGMVTGSQLDAESQPVDVTTISYGADGVATSVNNLGDVRQHVISGGQFSAITKTTDAQGSRSFNFNTSGRLTSKIDALGNRTTIDYTDSSGAVSQVVTRTEESIGRITRTTRDANNQIAEERESRKLGTAPEELASLTRKVADAQGRTLFSCQYDVTQPTDYVCGSLAIAPSNVRQSANLYCTDADVAANPTLCPIPGLQRSYSDAAGNTTTFEYYAANDTGCDSGGACSHRKGDLRAQINALGQRTEYLEYDALGNAIQIRGIDGVVIERLYDHGSRVLAETIKGDAPANDRISLFEYNSFGRLTRRTGPDGVWTRMHYDTADRLVAVEDAAGNRINYTLDGAGNRTREEVRDANGTLTRVLDRTFDTASRMTRLSGADGHPTQFRYDPVGNLLESESPLGHISRNTFDGASRPKLQTQDPGGINAQVGYDYAANGQLERVVDPKGLATTYAYNGFGDLLQQVSPDTGTTTFTVDAAGNRTTRTDARGVTATYQYDVLGRVTHISYPDPTLDVAYTYDIAPAVCAANEQFSRGRVGTVIHAGGSTQYCHDRFGQLTRKVQTVNGVATTVRYGYTAGGRLATLTYPDGTVADYLRDSLGRINEVGVTGPGQARQVVVTNVTYAPFGPATGWTYGNGRTLQRPVDQDYRTIAVHDAAPGGLSVGYGYDAVGGITELTNGDGTEVLAQYSYDALGRLTQTKDGPTGTPIETYGYDATGNRTSLTSSSETHVLTYSAGSHRLMSVDGEVRSYDAAGNGLNIGSVEFEYGDSNRMAQVRQDGVVAVRFVYNHRGERVERAGTAGGSEFTVYDEAGRRLGGYSSNGHAGRQVVWLENYPVALVDEAQTSGSLAYIQPDHLGTPRVVIEGPTNQSVWEWSAKSEAFGSQMPNEDPKGTGSRYEFNARFPGQQLDADTQLAYNYFRDYEAATGRYLQSDPVGLSAGPSTYSYVGGSPLTSVDPLGLLQWNMGDAQWRSTLHYYGLVPSAFPGGPPGGPSPLYAAAATMDWRVQARCVCEGAEYRLEEFTIDLAPVVYMSHVYASAGHRFEVRMKEHDHLRDFYAWGDREQSAAASYERFLRHTTYSSEAECVGENNSLMMQSLRRSFLPAAKASIDRYDKTRLHDVSPW